MPVSTMVLRRVKFFVCNAYTMVLVIERANETRFWIEVNDSSQISRRSSPEIIKMEDTMWSGCN